MENLLSYQLQVAACLMLFYLFYRVLMQSEGYFVFRRFYLLWASGISFLLPALDLNFTVQSHEIPFDYLNLLPVQAIHLSPPDQSQAFSPLLVFLWIWAIGLGIMIFRLILSMYYVKKILKKAEPLSNQGLLLSNGNEQSFSFFKTIVLSHKHYHSKSMKYILAHEQAHTSQHHSIDVFLMEMLKAVQWFNPFAWLLGNEVTQNLEYLADQQVVKSLQDKEEYQMAIVQFAHNSGSTLLKTEFSKSNLKNRIMMMNNLKVQKFQTWKLLLLLPLVGTMLMSFSVKIENLDLKKEVTQMLPLFDESIPKPSIEIDMAKMAVFKDSSDQVYTVVEHQPVPAVGLNAYYEEIAHNLKYPQKSKDMGIEGKVYVEFVVRKDGSLTDIKVIRGIAKDCDEAAMDVVKNGSEWLPGNDKGKPVDVRLVLPVNFSLGDGGKQKPTDSKMGKSESRIMIQSTEKNADNPLMILDGQEITSEELAKIDPSTLASMSVLKDQSAVNVYGEKGKNGVVLITSKNGKSATSIESEKNEEKAIEISEASNIQLKSSGQLIDKNNQPLIYMDGVEISYDEMGKIDHNNIKSIEVLKDESAKNSYGKKGKNGVILITSK